MARKAAAKRVSDPFPEDALRDLERRLADGKALPPLVLMRGEERAFRQRGVDLAVRAAKAVGMDICRHDALDPEYQTARLLDDLMTGALFAPARCIVLSSAERVVVDRASKASKPVREAILARVAAGGPGMVVLSAEKLMATHAIVKAATESGVVVGCRRLWDTPPAWDPDPRKAELVQWIAGRARTLGIKIDLGEAAYVAAATGNDLAALEDQLQRLVGRGSEAISELVAWDASASPWDVAEHILTGDVRRAAAGIETLFSGGANQRDGSRTIDLPGIAAQLCTALSSKLREAVRAAEVLEAGGTPSAAAAAAGVRGARQAVAAFEKRMASRPPGAWCAAVLELAALERRTRSSVRVDATDFVHLALRLRARRATIAR